MAEYKLVDAEKLDADLKSVADAIRAKTKNSSNMVFPDGFSQAVSQIDAMKEEQTKLFDINTNGVFEINPDEGKVISSVTINVDVPNSIEGYVDGSITEIDLPNITSIKQNAFFNDMHITNVYMPNVTAIGIQAFTGCSNLNLTELPVNLRYIGVAAFSDCTAISFTCLPEKLSVIDNAIFLNCVNLKINSIPEKITAINYNAFYNCTRLTSITFKGTPRTIDSSAFRGCTNLTRFNVPWAEGEVANAPWGADNATINYNYTEG